MPVPQLEESEPNHHVVRVGWSVDATTYNLGTAEAYLYNKRQVHVVVFLIFRGRSYVIWVWRHWKDITKLRVQGIWRSF